MLTKENYNQAQLVNRFPFAIGNLRWDWKKPASFIFQESNLI